MDQRLLTDAFRRNYSTLVSSLSYTEVRAIASRLYSKRLLIKPEFESVALEEITASQACYRLVDFIMRRATNELYLTFLKILANNLHRLDLLELFDIPPCRVANERSNDDEQKICTRNSLWKSLRQSCILYDSHSSSRSDYRLPLISFEFEEMKKEKKMEPVNFYEIPISSDVLSESDAIQKLTISRPELVHVGVQLQNFKNITTLRIIHCQLTQIPQEVLCLTKLEELDLHGNCFENANITDFSDHLPHLKVLDVRYCGLKEISDWIGNLLQLEKLLISGNRLEGGLGRSLQRLKLLRYLDMANCKLKDLPDWLAELIMLQELYLSNNNFNAGKNSAIGQLHQLKKLDLSQCHISMLPTSLGDLEQLEELNLLSNNFTTGLSEAIGRLRQLKALYIGHCGLLTIPDWIHKLDKLQEINLSRNNFSNGINSAIGQLLRLKKLDLSQCRLSTLPNSFGRMEQLEELDLSGNHFTTGVSEAIGQFRHLKVLYIGPCGLLTIPDWIKNLDQLQEIDLSMNDFSAGINQAIGQLHRLRKLDLSRCSLSALPTSFGNLIQLEELSLWGNGSLKELPDSLEKLQSLIRLKVAACGLGKLPKWLQKLEKLKELDFSENPINSFPDEFFQMKNLRILRLGQCELAEVPQAFYKLTTLEHLDLSDNKLITFPHITVRLGNLRCLNVGNFTSKNGRANVITKLPFELSHSKLLDLYLDNNPLELPPLNICNRGLKSIKLFLTDLELGQSKLCNDTINLLGDSETGKTSIALSLMHGTPTAAYQDDRTCVIDQRKVSLGEKIVTVNDFGGHEIYHPIIGVFLPQGGICLIVYNLTDEEDKQIKIVKKWLLTILAKSIILRVIVVGTHAENFNGTRCKELEMMMQRTVEDVIVLARNEIVKHNNSAQPKDTFLTQEQLNGTDPLPIIPIVLMSCTTKDDKGFKLLQEIVAKMLNDDITFPKSWLNLIKSVYEERANSSSSRFYMKLDDLRKKRDTYLENDQDDEKMKLILKYLLDTSQVIRIEGSDLVYHDPHCIVDVCRQILKPDFRSETLRKNVQNEELLSTYEQDFNRGEISKGLIRSLLPHSDVESIIDFMQHFNLIAKINSNEQDEQFILPSNLLKNREDLAYTLQEMVCDSDFWPSVNVRLDFMGSIMPASFFEANMVAVISFAYAEHANPVIWKDGVIFETGTGYIEIERRGSSLYLKACDKQSVTALWKVLRLILDVIRSDIHNRWKGIPPYWFVLCPACLCNSKFGNSDQNDQKALVGYRKFQSGTSKRSTMSSGICSRCRAQVPWSLLMRLSPEPATSQNDDDEVNKFCEELRKKYSNAHITGENSLNSLGPTVLGSPTTETNVVDSSRHATSTSSGQTIVCLGDNAVNNVTVNNTQCCASSVGPGVSNTSEPSRETRGSAKSGRKRPRETTNRETSQQTSGSAKKAGVSGRGDNQATAMRSGNSLWKAMDTRRLESFFRKKYDKLTSTLTLPESKKIASVLYAQKKLIPSEWEEVSAITTATTAAQKLVDYIMKKNEKQTYCTFLEVLESSGGRKDLIDDLLSTLES